MVREAAKKKLEADIPAELHDRLKQWISDHKNGSMRQCAQAMTELWLSLPEELQALTLICPNDSPSFKEVVRCTIEILRGRQGAGPSIAASPKTRYDASQRSEAAVSRKAGPKTGKKKK